MTVLRRFVNKSSVQQLLVKCSSARADPVQAVATTSSDEDNVNIIVHTQDELSQQIYGYYMSQRQSKDLFVRKVRLRQQLEKAILEICPGSSLHIVGSSLNGFGSRHSDMDLCIVPGDRALRALLSDHSSDRRKEAIDYLSRIRNHLKRKENLISHFNLIAARTPVLQLQFQPPMADVHVDLSASSPVSIYNTHLLFHYGQYDWRTAPLVLVAKAWAKQQGISDASQGRLSSFSLELMTIHYLQYAVKPPILPCLQTSHRFEFVRERPCENLSYAPLQRLSSERRANNQWLGELFKGFLLYYGKQFNYRKNVISVRTGSIYDRTRFMGAMRGKNGICVEEPFTGANVAYAVHDQAIFDDIVSSFRTSYIALNARNTLSAVLR